MALLRTLKKASRKAEKEKEPVVTPNVIDIRQPEPTPITEPTPAPNQTIKRSDYPLGEEGAFQYEQEKRKAMLPTAENVAARRILDAQREAAIQGEVTKQMPISPEEQALAAQQQQETQQLQGMLESQPSLTASQRNVQAGIATINSVAQTLGFKETGVVQGEVGGLGRAGLTILGKAATTNVPLMEGFSLSDLFSKSNSGNIKELTGDANAITARARLVYADASSRGGDKTAAIQGLRLTEEAVRQRYNDAMIALAAAPKEVSEGIDFTEEIYSNLVTLQAYRQALERQQLTGETNQGLLNSNPNSI